MYNHKIKSVRIACFNFGLELKSGLKSIGTIYSLDVFLPKNSCLKKEVHLKRSFFFKVFKSTPSTLFLKNFNISSEKMLGLRLTLNFVSVSTVLLHKFVKKSTEL